MGAVPPGTDLAPRNPGVRPWAELSADEQRLALRLQEAFAAFLDHTDAQIGRLVGVLDELRVLDDTMIVLLSDNGASQEGGPIGVLDTMRYFNGVPEDLAESVARLDDIGGPRSNANYPWGWAQAGNTPLKRYKQNTHGGGVRDPLVVHWPAGITDPGGIRPQFCHVTDIAPTVLELAGLDTPEVYRGVHQQPVCGTSLAYTLSTEGAGAPTRKDVQHFEMFGHRGIWHDGWKAVAYHEKGTDFDDDTWELYNLDEDFSECHDLAAERPDKLRELVERWWAEAGRHGGLPLDDRSGELFGATGCRHLAEVGRRFVLYPPIALVNADAAPPLGARSFTIDADISRDAAGDGGVIVAYGASTSGFCLYLQDGRVVFDYNLYTHHYRAVSPVEVLVGEATVGVRFTRIGKREAEAVVTVGGEAGEPVRIPGVLRMISALGMDVGRDPGSPACDDYEAPFPFTGTISGLVFEVPERSPAADAEADAADARAQPSRQ